MDKKDDNKSAFAAAAMATRAAPSMDAIIKQYRKDNNIHSVGGTNDDRLAKKEAYIADQRHQKELDVQNKILELTKQRIELENQGDANRANDLNKKIASTRRDGPDDIGFDFDVVSKNFSSTFEEIALNFSDMTVNEQKGTLKRMEALQESLENSNAVEKDFLQQQLMDIRDSAQNEYNKRATIAARALQKSSELAEQYLDVSSLYAGFVDHNPVMMAVWRIGADLIRRNRTMKRAQKEAIIRDDENLKAAEKLNALNEANTERETQRDNEKNAIVDQILKVEREAAEDKKAMATEPPASTVSPSNKVKSEDPKPDVESVDGFDASGFFDGIQSDDPEPVIQREQTNNSQAFEFPQDKFSGTGDEPLTQDFMASLFGETDEDGDSTGFIREESNEPIVLDDSTPIQVQPAEETTEQKAQAMFIRQDSEETKRINDERHIEQIQRDEKTINKLIDIEDAIRFGNKLTENNGEALKNVDGGIGLFEALALGLGNIAALFKGPILKALMLFGPAVTAIGALVSKIGLGGVAGKLTGGFDGLTEKMGGDRNARRERANKPRGSVATGAKGIAGKAGNFARAGGGILARGGGMLARGAMGLLGTTVGAATAAGATGYGVGTLLNDHVLPDDTKRGIGEFIGPKIDRILSLFGNDDARHRGMMEKLEQHNGQTLGIADPNVGLETVPDDLSVMEKHSNGNQLVVQADDIQINKVVNARGAESIEVPIQKQTEEKLQMLEEKVIQLADAKVNAENNTVVTMAPQPTKQKIVQNSPSDTPLQSGRSARNDDSSIQRLTDRFVGMGMA